MSNESETSICNMALGGIGAERISDINSSSVNAVHCQLHYPHTRDALQRSFEWSFAIAQSELSEDSETPDFHYDHQFLLPDDFQRVTINWDDNCDFDYAIQGQLLLTDEDEIDLEYIKQVTDTTVFDDLFVEVLVLKLQLKLLHPVAGTGATALQLKQGILIELKDALSRAKCVNDNELNTSGGYRWSPEWE
jgi:hypothetical protein